MESSRFWKSHSDLDGSPGAVTLRHFSTTSGNLLWDAKLNVKLAINQEHGLIQKGAFCRLACRFQIEFEVLLGHLFENFS